MWTCAIDCSSYPYKLYIVCYKNCVPYAHKCCNLDSIVDCQRLLQNWNSSAAHRHRYRIASNPYRLLQCSCIQFVRCECATFAEMVLRLWSMSTWLDYYRQRQHQCTLKFDSFFALIFAWNIQKKYLWWNFHNYYVHRAHCHILLAQDCRPTPRTDQYCTRDSMVPALILKNALDPNESDKYSHSICVQIIDSFQFLRTRNRSRFKKYAKEKG